MVVPILVYGSEVWGFYSYKEEDKIHFNNAVYGESGRLKNN